ncbi:MAG TPA: DnaJ domain-containing protein [Vicinamibacterales bacterium]|nr:DnaJ domain-containing protein [Vicinamibacterales bacterium]
MSFAEILDSELGCTNVPPAARVWSGRPVTAPLFAFELPLTVARPAPSPFPAPAPVESGLPVHLTAHDRKAMDDARTPDALRRAYRTLARRYHPDRHQGCSAAERERLARLFAEATELYSSLRTGPAGGST